MFKVYEETVTSGLYSHTLWTSDINCVA